MKKSILKGFLMMALVVTSVMIFAGCQSVTKSNIAYWFSSYNKKFVEYSDTANNNLGNINESGNYWEMTVKKDCNVSIAFANDSYTMFSGTYFYVNNKQVKSEPSGIFTWNYPNLNLKKGDKIKIHCFWTNSLQTNKEGFKMDTLIISDNEGNWNITDF